MSWALPDSWGDFPHRTDFREILKLLALLGDEGKPDLLRWQAALCYFFRGEFPEDTQGAMAYMADFLTAGEPCAPGPKLYDWAHDAQRIAAGVNAVAGREVRAMEYLHWWTFLGYFRAMGEGEFSLVVGIRDKLRRGRKLEAHEQEYYRAHRAAVKLPTPDSPEKRRLEALLQGE